MIRLLWPLLLTGCFTYTNATVNTPVDADQFASLERGMELQVCLDKLGAPIRVWETEANRFAIAYGWLRERGWGFRLSYSFDVFLSASLTFDSDLAKARGCVLWFDEDLKLVDYRAGLLGDLISPRRRPNDVEILKEGRAREAETGGR